MKNIFLVVVVLFISASPFKSIIELSDTVEFKNEHARNLFKNDVFEYFNLQEKYNSPLKKKIFTRSEEYKTKTKKLKQLRLNTLKSRYYVVSKKVSNYDIKKSGVYVALGRNSKTFNRTGDAPKTFKYAYFKSLPIESKLLLGRIRNDRIFIKLSEKAGLEIEENKKSIILVLSFDISKPIKIKYSAFVEMGAIIGTGNYSELFFPTKNVEIFLFNTKTQKILFKKKYKDE